jgi:membrane protein DedA with SNARE-associated domain
MFDSIVETIAEYPYLGVAFVFLLCGLGFPLPEELVLIAGGYVCAKFPDKAVVPWMMVWCSGAILAGDLLPFVAGRVFGTRMLRVRWLRLTVTRKRLAKFDRWFRRRGDLVIFIARFLAGIRVVAFFTAGTMKMPWRRFLLLDGLGIAIIVPLLIWVGYHSAGVIDDVIARVQAVERGLLWSVGGVAILLSGWYWLWRRRRRAATVRPPAETYVEPRLPIQETAPAPAGAPIDSGSTAPAAAAPAGAVPAEPGPSASGSPALPTTPPAPGGSPPAPGPGPT